MPQGVDKGAALARLLTLTGRSAQSLTAFGDSYNDATMLSLAGTAVAMQNARQEIRAMADIVTVSNDEDGVALYIESHMTT
jgi:hydroxymethylpyrimidine pyrophosphatase-like HAD family hydrolase